MLNIKPPNFLFCPFCGKKLEIRTEEEKERKFCPSCKWTYYPHVSGSACAIIIRKNKVLLVKRGREPYEAPRPDGLGIFSSLLRREQNPTEAKNSSRSFPILRSGFSAKEDKNTWMFPAGFVDFGEHPEETARREVREETGLKLKKAELFKVLQSEDDPRSPGHFLFFYKVAAEESKLRTDKEENQEINWFDIKNPPTIGWESHRKIMKLLQEEMLDKVSK